MTKAEIVNEISNKTGIDKQAVQSVVESFMTSVKSALSEMKTYIYVVLEVLS